MSMKVYYKAKAFPDSGKLDVTSSRAECCCKTMEKHYGSDGIALDVYDCLSGKELPYVFLHYMEADYGDWNHESVRMDYCPFCGSAGFGGHSLIFGQLRNSSQVHLGC